jgi:hypothetical protein
MFQTLFYWLCPVKWFSGHIFCWQKGTQTRLRCSWVELIYSIYTNMHRSSSRAGSLSYLISTRVLLDLTISNMRLFLVNTISNQSNNYFLIQTGWTNFDLHIFRNASFQSFINVRESFIKQTSFLNLSSICFH